MRERGSRRRQLCADNDYLRLRLSAGCRHLRRTTQWIEQGYRLARALSHEPERARLGHRGIAFHKSFAAFHKTTTCSTPPPMNLIWKWLLSNH